jgi:hypothetical protein
MSTVREAYENEFYDLGPDKDTPMTNCGGTCDYVARKQEPSNWHGDDPDEWILEDEAPVGLEQEVWECPHEALDGEEYCPFHTDPEDLADDVDEGEQFVNAVNEASAVEDEETARRRKEFVGATFGPFDIEEATLDAGDEHPIRLDHARFACGVNAEGAIFEHSVLAARARFGTSNVEATGEIGAVSFRLARFMGREVSFYQAEFESLVSFSTEPERSPSGSPAHSISTATTPRLPSASRCSSSSPTKTRGPHSQISLRKRETRRLPERGGTNAPTAPRSGRGSPSHH